MISRSIAKTLGSRCLVLRSFAQRQRQHQQRSKQSQEGLAELMAADIPREQYPAKRLAAINFMSTCTSQYVSGVTDEKALCSLVQLPLTFGHHPDGSYWAVLNKGIQPRLSTLSVDTKLFLMEMMRTFGRQEEPLFGAVMNDLVDIVAEKPGELVRVAIASCGWKEAGQEARKRIEELMIKHVDSISVAHICELITELCLNHIHMDGFLSKAKGRVIGNLGNVPTSAYAAVLATYGPSGYEEVVRPVEEKVAAEFQTYTLKELTNIIVAFAEQRCGSEELFLQFEKRVGKGIDFIDQEDIAPLLAAFVNRGFFREKLLTHFIKKVKGVAHMLPIQDLASIAETYTKARMDSCVVHEMLEPYIIKRKEQLDPTSLLRVVYGYANIGRKSNRIYEELEEVAMRLAGMSDAFTLVRIAYGYARAKKGGEEWMRKMLERLAKIGSELDPIGAVHFLELATSAKAGDEIVRLAMNQVMQKIALYDKDDLGVISEIAASDQRLNKLIECIPLTQ